MADKFYLSNKVGNARVDRDFTLDYASMMNQHPDVKDIREIERGIRYTMKDGGTIDLVAEHWGGGNAVVYFNDGCPRKYFQELDDLVRKTVDEVNEHYKVHEKKCNGFYG